MFALKTASPFRAANLERQLVVGKRASATREHHPITRVRLIANEPYASKNEPYASFYGRGGRCNDLGSCGHGAGACRTNHHDNQCSRFARRPLADNKLSL